MSPLRGSTPFRTIMKPFLQRCPSSNHQISPRQSDTCILVHAMTALPSKTYNQAIEAVYITMSCRSMALPVCSRPAGACRTPAPTAASAPTPGGSDLALVAVSCQGSCRLSHLLLNWLEVLSLSHLLLSWLRGLSLLLSLCCCRLGWTSFLNATCTEGKINF